MTYNLASLRLLNCVILAERATGLEPATSSLGSWHSTTELRPHSHNIQLGPACGGILKTATTHFVRWPFLKKLAFYHCLSAMPHLLAEITPAVILLPFLNCFEDFFACFQIRGTNVGQKFFNSVNQYNFFP